MGDVTLNADTCNSNIQENVDYRKDEPPSDNRSIRSWIERCQSEDGKSDTEKQQNEKKICGACARRPVQFSKEAERTDTSRN